jgi:putative methionine-R-sulfoxide reductase with GAF domain
VVVLGHDHAIAHAIAFSTLPRADGSVEAQAAELGAQHAAELGLRLKQRGAGKAEGRVAEAPRSSGDALESAQATIARQEEEIARLRRQLADEEFARGLHEALIVAKTAGTIAAPVSHDRLLEMIVETAADVLSARGASLFLIDQEKQELVFEVALGAKAAEVAKFRVPLGHGIAGLVALTGQAMAVADASNDPRQASDISEQIGYFPQSLLCVPLFYNDQIIGVLELLDKKDAPAFVPADLEHLGLFANLAGVAIEQSRTRHNVATLVHEVVQALQGIPREQRRELLAGTDDFARHLEQGDASYARALETAYLVHEIVVHGGDAASRAVQSILHGFLDYLQSWPQDAPLDLE